MQTDDLPNNGADLLDIEEIPVESKIGEEVSNALHSPRQGILHGYGDFHTNSLLGSANDGGGVALDEVC
jgi:hypothetical protein